MAFVATKSALALAKPTARPAAVARPSVSRPALRSAARQQPVQQRGASVAARVAPVEVAQLAGEAGFIGGVALTMTAITLLGLAVGFVLLRVESLVEEGKL